MKSNVIYEKLPIVKMNPTILFSQVFHGNQGFQKGEVLPARCVRDYELEYFIDGEGSMFIDEEHIPVQKGDIIFRKPGQYTQGIMPYSCYFISFDMANSVSNDSEWYNTCLWERDEIAFQPCYCNSILDHIPTKFHIQNEDKYYSLFDTVFQAYVKPNMGSELLMKASVLNILYYLYQDSCNPANTMHLSPYGRIISNAITYINEYFHQPLSLKQIAEQVGLSPNYFHKIFSDLMKITLNDYITTVRLNKAKELLLGTNTTIYNIADQCGFSNVSYFSYLFKKSFHVTPIEFRNSHSYVYYGIGSSKS